MKIGIHTGRIIGGIIGTKFVRYEIFSHDVLISKSIMENCTNGTVSISEPTNALIQKSSYITEALKVEEFNEVEAYDKTYQTYTIENIVLSEEEGQSQEESSEGTGTEEEEGGSGASFDDDDEQEVNTNDPDAEPKPINDDGSN